MTDAEAKRGGIGQAGREPHHHEIGRRVGSTCPTCTRDSTLGRGRNQFKEEVPEVSFVEGDAELAFLDQRACK